MADNRQRAEENHRVVGHIFKGLSIPQRLSNRNFAQRLVQSLNLAVFGFRHRAIARFFLIFFIVISTADIGIFDHIVKHIFADSLATGNFGIFGIRLSGILTDDFKTFAGKFAFTLKLLELGKLFFRQPIVRFRMFFDIGGIIRIGPYLIIVVQSHFTVGVLLEIKLQSVRRNLILKHFLEGGVIFKTMKIVIKRTRRKNRTIAHVNRIAGGNEVHPQPKQRVFAFKLLAPVHYFAETVHTAAEFAALFHKVGNRFNVGLGGGGKCHLFGAVVRIDRQHFENFFFGLAGADRLVDFQNPFKMGFAFNIVVFVAESNRIKVVIVFNLNPRSFFLSCGVQSIKADFLIGGSQAAAGAQIKRFFQRLVVTAVNADIVIFPNFLLLQIAAGFAVEQLISLIKTGRFDFRRRRIKIFPVKRIA